MALVATFCVLCTALTNEKFTLFFENVARSFRIVFYIFLCSYFIKKSAEVLAKSEVKNELNCLRIFNLVSVLLLGLIMGLKTLSIFSGDPDEIALGHPQNNLFFVLGEGVLPILICLAYLYMIHKVQEKVIK